MRHRMALVKGHSLNILVYDVVYGGQPRECWASHGKSSSTAVCCFVTCSLAAWGTLGFSHCCRGDEVVYRTISKKVLQVPISSVWLYMFFRAIYQRSIRYPIQTLHKRVCARGGCAEYNLSAHNTPSFESSHGRGCTQKSLISSHEELNISPKK